MVVPMNSFPVSAPSIFITGSLSPVKIASSTDNFHAFNQVAVRRDALAVGQQHQVAGHQLAGINFFSDSVPQDGGGFLDQALQRFIGALGLVFLHKAQNGVDHHHRHDDEKIPHLAHQQRYKRGSEDDIHQRALELVQQDHQGRNPLLLG